jgi:hypothetical protein
MRQKSLLSAVLLLLIVSRASAAPREDTERLATHLKSARGKHWLSTTEYKRLQHEYLDWIDARMEAGVTTEVMNKELKAARLFPPWTNPNDEYSTHNSGFLEEISAISVRGVTDILAIRAGIYKGDGCSLDITVALYKKNPLTRLGSVNALREDPQYAYYLSGLDVGEEGATGKTLVASGWVISHCTSMWNGKRIRIDWLNGGAGENVLEQNVEAQDREETENVAAWVQGNVVTFWYQGAVDILELMSGPSVARYRVMGDRAIRETPLALTRAGFIREWLRLSYADALRWGEPEAVKMRDGIVSASEKRGFELARVARCGGSPPIWEVAVRIGDLKKSYVFRISGARATELRMLSIAASSTRSCIEAPSEQSGAIIGAELPW